MQLSNGTKPPARAAAVSDLAAVFPPRENLSVLGPPAVPGSTPAVTAEHLKLITDDRKREILAQRLGIGCPPRTLEQLAPHFNLTRERIRQLQNEAAAELESACPNLGVDLKSELKGAKSKAKREVRAALRSADIESKKERYSSDIEALRGKLKKANELLDAVEKRDTAALRAIDAREIVSAAQLVAFVQARGRLGSMAKILGQSTHNAIAFCRKIGKSFSPRMTVRVFHELYGEEARSIPHRATLNPPELKRLCYEIRGFKPTSQCPKAPPAAPTALHPAFEKLKIELERANGLLDDVQAGRRASLSEKRMSDITLAIRLCALYQAQGSMKEAATLTGENALTFRESRTALRQKLGERAVKVIRHYFASFEKEAKAEIVLRPTLSAESWRKRAAEAGVKFATGGRRNRSTTGSFDIDAARPSFDKLKALIITANQTLDAALAPDPSSSVAIGKSELMKAARLVALVAARGDLREASKSLGEKEESLVISLRPIRREIGARPGYLLAGFASAAPSEFEPLVRPRETYDLVWWGNRSNGTHRKAENSAVPSIPAPILPLKIARLRAEAAKAEVALDKLEAGDKTELPYLSAALKFVRLAALIHAKGDIEKAAELLGEPVTQARESVKHLGADLDLTLDSDIRAIFAAQPSAIEGLVKPRSNFALQYWALRVSQLKRGEDTRPVSAVAKRELSPPEVQAQLLPTAPAKPSPDAYASPRIDRALSDLERYLRLRKALAAREIPSKEDIVPIEQLGAAFVWGKIALFGFDTPKVKLSLVNDGDRAARAFETIREELGYHVGSVRLDLGARRTRAYALGLAERIDFESAAGTVIRGAMVALKAEFPETDSRIAAAAVLLGFDSSREFRRFAANLVIPLHRI